MRRAISILVAVALPVCSIAAGSPTGLSDTWASGGVVDVGSRSGGGGGSTGPGQYEFVVAGGAWDDRPYRINVPDGYDAEAPLPLLVVFHGSSSNAVEMARTTCRGLVAADAPSVQHPTCLHHMATGAITAYLNGSIDENADPHPSGGFRRSWNAGGGRRIGGVDFKCVSNSACERNDDDVAYVLDVLDDIGRRLSVEADRVYAVGLSNGAAMVHRLACEVPGRFAGVAAVGGTNNQHAVDLAPAGGCAAGSTGVLQIFGEADPISPPGGGPSPLFPAQGAYVSIEEMLHGFRSVPGVVQRNGCADEPPLEELVANEALLDGSPGGVIYRFRDCTDDVVVYRLWDAGHTWPDGWQYLGQWLIGPTNRDISANAVILDFFGF